MNEETALTLDTDMTPIRAISLCINDLQREKATWGRKTNAPADVLAYIDIQLAALELARRQLRDFDDLKSALAMVANIMDR